VSGKKISPTIHIVGEEQNEKLNIIFGINPFQRIKIKTY